jgi:hypothetical protein
VDAIALAVASWARPRPRRSRAENCEISDRQSAVGGKKKVGAAI